MALRTASRNMRRSLAPRLGSDGCGTGWIIVWPKVTAIVDNSPIRQANYRIRWESLLASVCGMVCGKMTVPGIYSVLLSFMNMTEQRVSYTLDSSLETIDSAEEKATRIATELGFGDDEIMQISMAVREGAVNAVLHGNAYAPDKKVILAFERTGGDLIITIRDQGPGMDLSKIPNPLAPENLLKTSGRGIFLMRSFMDVVEIRPTQTGTELKLIKHVHGPTAGGEEASQ
jgi:serine/threonine-protein kinase RsbW